MQTEHTEKAAGRGDRLDRSIQEFLDRYATALSAGDGKAIAALWEMPALVVDDHGVIPVGKAEEVEQFFTAAHADYNQRGITSTRAEIVRLEWPTDRIAQVDVRWIMLDASGHERGDESTTYTLRRDDAGNLRLRCAVTRGGSES
jgi:ketosteroid isomerase-like protein